MNRSILSIYLFIFYSLILIPTHCYASLFLTPPDGENIIAINDAAGDLFIVTSGVYVQTNDEVFLHDISALINRLKSSKSGQALLKQVAEYAPISPPGIEPAKAFDFNSIKMDVNVNVIIRQSTDDKRFVAEPILTDLSKITNASNGLGVPTVIYFDTQNSIYLPGTDEVMDLAVALGHELIHARDYLSGGIPKGIRTLHNITLPQSHHGSDEVIKLNVDLQRREYEATGIAYSNESALSLNALTPTREKSLHIRQQWKSAWRSALQSNKITSDMYQRNIAKITPFKHEKPISEFHIASELSAPKRNMYWPKDLYDYELTSVLSPAEKLTRKLLTKFNGHGQLKHIKNKIMEMASIEKNTAVTFISPYFSGIKHLGSLKETDKKMLAFAAKNNMNVKIILPHNLSGQTLIDAQTDVIKRKNLYHAYKKGLAVNRAESSFTTVYFKDDQFIDAASDLHKIQSFTLIGDSTNDISLKIAKVLHQKLRKPLIILRTPGEYLPIELLNHSLAKEWGKLANNNEVTLISSAGLPRSKRCWRL
ncbi:hypothetical protein HQQ94_21815 [Shewanella sp. VB17]|uniref:M91 family zinc metallopeptidase n=1 Tax=Shewanella sp. VB17 TaxID=2739432 RepID=UPI0015674BD0|nr:M91 family zinc metallopeptidase [Shewanella sp. VB17]NRD75804.1 hypothetical protein [Shewanella sp. VB17]